MSETSTPASEIHPEHKIMANPNLTKEVLFNDSVLNGRSGVIGRSPCFLATLDIAKRAARSCANIFICGESGTGKEVVGRFIHYHSRRSQGPFVAVNCSAIPENLLESELFGHAKGSFTGAVENKAGLFEEANNGTIFLDEIGDLNLTLQSKLLRVLQEKKVRRVGENRMRDVNARVLSATNKDLGTEIERGAFREDLYYRLSVIPIELPPLRDRPDDISILAEAFLKKFSVENYKHTLRLSNDALEVLSQKHWRGNVRELENTIERAVVLCKDSILTKDDFSDCALHRSLESIDQSNKEPRGGNDFVMHFEKFLPPLDEVINSYVAYAVAYNLGAKDRTAKDLGIDRKTLYKRLNNSSTC